MPAAILRAVECLTSADRKRAFIVGYPDQTSSGMPGSRGWSIKSPIPCGEIIDVPDPFSCPGNETDREEPRGCRWIDIRIKARKLLGTFGSLSANSRTLDILPYLHWMLRRSDGGGASEHLCLVKRNGFTLRDRVELQSEYFIVLLGARILKASGHQSNGKSTQSRRQRVGCLRKRRSDMILSLHPPATGSNVVKSKLSALPTMSDHMATESNCDAEKFGGQV